MSYVMLPEYFGARASALGGYTTIPQYSGLAGKKALDLTSVNPLLSFVQANRAFTSRLIVDWLDNNRGMCPFGKCVPGAELGVKQKGRKGTTLDKKYVDLSRAYDTLKQKKNENDKAYDTMRVATLGILLKRDLLHLFSRVPFVLAKGDFARNLANFKFDPLLKAFEGALRQLGEQTMRGLSQMTVPPKELQDFLNNVMSFVQKATNLPKRSVPGLGAFTSDGFTVEYYENPNLLKFQDPNLKATYEVLRNADHGFQKIMKMLGDAIAEVVKAVRSLIPGIEITPEQVRRAFKIPLPTAGVAMLLEVAAGGKMLDRTMFDLLDILGQQAEFMLGVFGIMSGLAGTVSAFCWAFSWLGVPAIGAAVFTPITSVGTVGVLVTGPLSILFKAIAKTQKTPTRKQFKDMIDLSCRLSFAKMKTDAEINKMYAELLAKTDPAAAKASAPKASAPKASAPKASAPKAFAPKAFAPKAFAPKAFAPKAFAPKALAPVSAPVEQVFALVPSPAAAETKAACFPASARVLTPYGYYALGQIQEGDFVVSGDGKIETVTKKLSYPACPLARVSLEGRTPLVTTMHHTVLTQRGWLRVDQLRKGDCLRGPTGGSVLAVNVGQSEPVFNLHTTGDCTFVVEGVVVHSFTEFRELRTMWRRLFSTEQPQFAAR